METNRIQNTMQSSNKGKFSSILTGKIIRAFLCFVIVGSGFLGANYLIHSAPKPKRRPPEKMAPLVKAIPIYPADHDVVISAMGTVIPSKEMVLKSRVSGEIVKIHPEFIEGGFLQKGTEVLQIDDADYQLAVARKQSSIVNAEYALQLELGRQAVAKREWELINGEKTVGQGDADLALRKPHLEKVNADLKAAEADLAQAKLDLERTKVKAPFNAIVRMTRVELGSQISAQENLAELVSIDEYWVKVSIPVDRLQWITIPSSRKEKGSTARIVYGSGAELVGVVIKLLSDLETEGRMARVLISVANPLGLGEGQPQRPPLLLGEYVRVEITGPQIEGSYRIPRTALRDNLQLWILANGGILDIREVEPFWRDKDTVFLKEGISSGELLIVSDLSTPVEGMTLRLEGQDNEDNSSESMEKTQDPVTNLRANPDQV